MLINKTRKTSYIEILLRLIGGLLFLSIIHSVYACDTVTISPLILVSDNVIPNSQTFNQEYTWNIVIFNPNSIDIPLTLTLQESHDQLDFDVTDTYYSTSGNQQTVPRNGYAYYSFTYGHYGNPFSSIENQIQEKGDLDEAMRIWLNSYIQTITGTYTSLIMNNKLFDLTLLIHDISKDDTLKNVLILNGVEYHYSLSASPNSVNGIPTTFSAKLTAQSDKNNYFLVSLISDLAGMACTSLVNIADAKYQPYVGIFLEIWEAELMTISKYSLQSAIDPNVNYTEPIIEQSFNISGLDSLPSCTLKDVAEQLDITISHQMSFFDAYTKYQGALEANNTTWKTIRLKDCYKYESLLYNDYQILYQKSVPAIESLQDYGLNPNTSEINNSSLYYQQNGIPDYERNILQEAGFSNQYISNCSQLIANLSPDYVVNYNITLLQSFQDVSDLHLGNLQIYSNNLGDEAPPFANFTINSSIGQSPLVVQFNDTSLRSPTSWNWDFGDNNSSTLQNPNHIYSTPGYYTINLTVINLTTGSDSRIKYNCINVTPNNRPIANFTASPITGTIPLNVSFIDTSLGLPVYWYWDFGDNNSSTLQNPNHTYSSSGIFSINLTVTNISTGSNTIERLNLINVSNQ